MKNIQRNTLCKAERLRSKKDIQLLFSKNKSFTAYPFKLIYAPNPSAQSTPTALLTVVPKKKIKNAVDRNRIKRLIRECWRKNKHPLDEVVRKKNKQFAVGVIFLALEQTDYTTANQKINLLIQRFIETLEKEEDIPNEKIKK